MVMRYRGEKSTSFKPGHKKKAGRKPGVPNKLNLTVKEAILEAVAKYGRDGNGKAGMVGYFLKLCANEPLMAGLLSKILPTQITGKDGGAIQVLTLPPEMLKGLEPTELEVLENVLTKLGSGQVSGKPAPGGGSGDSYAKEIGYDDPSVTKH